jgi:hypothetical protein
MGRFYYQKPGISCSEVWLQLSIWVLIVSQHDQYIDCAVLVTLSPPAFRFAIQQVFGESWSNTHQFHLIPGITSQPLNKYQSDYKFECSRWQSVESWTIYILTMSWYDQNTNTLLEPKLDESYSWNHGPVRTWSNTHGSMCGLANDPTKKMRVRFLAGSGTELNRTAVQNLDPLQTLVLSRVHQLHTQ